MARFPWSDFEYMAPPVALRRDYARLPVAERIRRESGWVEEHLRWREGGSGPECGHTLQWRCIEGVASGVMQVLGGRAGGDTLSECACMALLKVIKSLGQWNRTQPIDHWCATIGRNTARDFLRRRGRGVQETPASQLSTSEDEDPDGVLDAEGGGRPGAGPTDPYCIPDLKDAIAKVVASNERARHALRYLLLGVTTDEELKDRGFSRYKQRAGLCAIWGALRRLGFFFDEVEGGLRSFSEDDWNDVYARAE